MWQQGDDDESRSFYQALDRLCFNAITEESREFFCPYGRRSLYLLKSFQFGDALLIKDSCIKTLVVFVSYKPGLLQDTEMAD
jgi:hypothetical protein